MKKANPVSIIKQACALAIVAVLLFAATPPIPVFATSSDPEQPSTPEEIRSYRSNTAWYDPSAGICDSNATTTLVGKDNIEKAFNFFLGKGLSAPQSAGIVGNLRQESGVNPSSNNTAAGPAGVNPSTIIPGETWNGGGIAQWEDYQSTPTRWTGPSGLLNFVAGKGTFDGKPQGDGRNWKLLAPQLDFVWWEMNNTQKSTLTRVKTTTTVENATIAFEEEYERAGDPRMENRIQYAKEVLALYGNGVSGSPDATTGCRSGIVVGNYSFPLAPQTKRNYGYTLPCTDATNQRLGQNGEYTKNGVYTDRYGTSTKLRTCHHDATPAFDLSYGAEATGNQPIYAVTDGVITKVGQMYKTKYPWGKACNTIHLRANLPTDRSYYWYGHVLASVAEGKQVKAGDVIGKVAPYEYGPRCWEGGVHVHVDRGCFNPKFDKLSEQSAQPGGSKDCRDPAFLLDLQAIWESLEEA